MSQLTLFGGAVQAGSSGGILSSFPAGQAAGSIGGAGAPIIGSFLSPFDKAAGYWSNSMFPVQQLNEYALTILLFRGEIEETLWFDIMKMLGYEALNATRFLQSMKPLPSKSDQVRFVVKEGYTPETIKDLLLEEGMEAPPEFVKQMHRLGFNTEDAQIEWRTHYDPLGRGEFEEMRQRLSAQQLKFKTADLTALGIKPEEVQFESADLLRMYKIRDVFPALRKRLELISFKPITRIDIRRLEDFGLLSVDELEFRNREAGYSPADAKFLAKWTNIANTFTDVKALLKQTAITKAEATQMLIEAGAEADDAERLILRILPVIKKEKAAANRDLSLTTLEDAYNFKLITRAQFTQTMLVYGFDATETELYIRTAEMKAALSLKKQLSAEKNLTPSQILKSYEIGERSKSAATTGLVSIGYDKAEAEELIKQVDIKLSAKKK